MTRRSWDLLVFIGLGSLFLLGLAQAFWGLSCRVQVRYGIMSPLWDEVPALKDQSALFRTRTSEVQVLFNPIICSGFGTSVLSAVMYVLLLRSPRRPE